MQGAELKLSKGDWVFHPQMSDWGYGKVLEVINGSKGRVFFLFAGEKKLSWEHAGLNRVEGDTVSQAALNDQLREFKLRLAQDLLASEELSQGVTCTACESLSSKCELCGGASEGLRVYSLSHKGRMCICEVCRDGIMLETKDKAAVQQSILEMEKRSKKEAADAAKKKKKPKIIKK
ncbi:MAG: DUF3553 domain-containing protein [Syntrophobacteraceae bacterium]|nr:DUF3553 domain-containing protein [Syntrophobacteraceae bacterium]